MTETWGLFQMQPSTWPTATPEAPTHGWVPDESETEMTEHKTTVTADGHTATCTCGWQGIHWPYADGSAYTDAARHGEVTA